MIDIPAGDVMEPDWLCCWPLPCWVRFPQLPLFNFLNCFLCFIRRFWNQVFTCVSERWRAAANSTLSGVLRYLCASNLASKPASCWSLKTFEEYKQLCHNASYTSPEIITHLSFRQFIIVIDNNMVNYQRVPCDRILTQRNSGICFENGSYKIKKKSSVNWNFTKYFFKYQKKN